MSTDLFQRHPDNPVLKAEDVPYPATLTFNAGVTRYGGKYVMVFRNDFGPADAEEFRDHGWEHTNMGLATSDDGVEWSVSPKPCFDLGDPQRKREIRRTYDPRLTVIAGRCYMCFAMDTNHGVCGGLAVTEDFDNWRILSTTMPDNRNMVLFPEKLNGEFMRLERPFSSYCRTARNPSPEATAFDCWYSQSPDGIYWGRNHLVLGSEQVPYANDKIGPAAPPIRTERGWLTTIHAVYRDDDRPLNTWQRQPWCAVYTAGLALLDLDEPWKVIGMTPEPVLSPQDSFAYEVKGFRGGVVFPGGMILEDNGEVRLYYGAADTVECLATAHVDDLLDAIEPF